MQPMFQLMGGGDKSGSGMHEILAGWRAQRWRSQQLDETLQPDRVRRVLLELRFPDVPNRPDQAYRTVAALSQ